jgi:hypothetical protein
MSLLFVLLYVLMSGMWAQDDVPLCENGADTVLVRYDWGSTHLSLVSWTTGETIRDFAVDFPVEAFYVLEWSPDCGHVLAEVTTGGEKWLHAWNTSTGQAAGRLGGSAYALRTLWSPDSNYLLLQYEPGGYLWNMQQGTPLLLNTIVESYFKRSFYRAEFVMARNELLVVQVGSGKGVTAYDLATGQKTGFYHIGERAAPVTYRRLDGDRSILVYSDGRDTLDYAAPEGIALWDRETRASVQLDPNDIQQGLTSWSTFDILGDLSTPYLVIADYGIYNGKLYVWNLNDRSGDTPLMPSYQQALYQAGDIRLIDSRMLEVADWSVWAHLYTPLRMGATVIDVETSSVINQTPRRYYEWVCRTPPEEFRWACKQAAQYSYRDDADPGENNSTYFAPQIPNR